jgi:hypothetical protein
MIVEVVVKCVPGGDDVQRLRTLLCTAQRAKDFSVNPLTTTDFNATLNRVVQSAFEEGRSYERNQANG